MADGQLHSSGFGLDPFDLSEINQEGPVAACYHRILIEIFFNAADGRADHRMVHSPSVCLIYFHIIAYCFYVQQVGHPAIWSSTSTISLTPTASLPQQMASSSTSTPSGPSTECPASLSSQKPKTSRSRPFRKRTKDMSDTLTPAQRSYNMSCLRSRNTSPERAVRNALWRMGYRYRLNDRRLPGSPDLVLPKYRAVIFINGCFWHGHRGCTKYVEPKTNAGFWKDKIARNIARDELNAQRLDTLAWTVITVWECELSKKNLDTTITRIEANLQAAKTKYEHYLSSAARTANSPVYRPRSIKRYSPRSKPS